MHILVNPTFPYINWGFPGCSSRLTWCMNHSCAIIIPLLLPRFVVFSECKKLRMAAYTVWIHILTQLTNHLRNAQDAVESTSIY